MIAAYVTTASKPGCLFLLRPSCFDVASTACLRPSCLTSGIRSGIAGCPEAFGAERSGSGPR